MSDTITGAPSLGERSERAAGGEWFASLNGADGLCRIDNGAEMWPLIGEWPEAELAMDLVNAFRAGRLHTSEALAQALVAAREETDWQDISTAPYDPMREYDFDLPGDADEGLGYATDTDTGVIAFLVWWTCTGPGRLKVTHWRPKIQRPLRPAQTDTTPGGRADG